MRPPFFPPFLALLSLLFASCAAPSKSFYVLTPEVPASAGGERARGAGVGVGPVSVAGYLDRPNLVFQESGNRLAISESHRWAGDLPENIARVTATNLSRLLRSSGVRVWPWESDEGLRYQVTLDILRLDGTPGGEAVLEASWRVYSLPDRRIAVSRSWSGAEPLERDGHEALVAAQSRLLARLAGEIAAGVR